MNRALALARLVRLPNVLTAIADISVGLLFGRSEIPGNVWITLPLASACFYSAGMAWNDYFDRHIDRIERPTRPIPSGAVTPRFAGWFAILFALTGVALASGAGWNRDLWSPLPLVHSIILVAAILAYDGWLKTTSFGPWIMGGCRLLNMLLGFSVLSTEIAPWAMRLHCGFALGLYVAGITIIARDEVQKGQARRLWIGALVSMLGCLMLALVTSTMLVPYRSQQVYLAAFAVVIFIGRFAKTQQNPTPEATQQFVKTAIMGIIVFDAIMAAGLSGPIGLVIVIWLIPAVILGRWVYST